MATQGWDRLGGVTWVPISPARAFSDSSGVVMTARRPPRSRNRRTAWTLGSMLPGANWPPAACPARVGRAQLVQVALGGAAEVDGDVLDPGEDQQDLGAQLGREQGRGQVLVDHRLDPGQGAVGPADHRDPAPAGRDHHRAGASRASMAGCSTISLGSGEGTTRRQPRPASSRIAQPCASIRRRASASS